MSLTSTVGRTPRSAADGPIGLPGLGPNVDSMGYRGSGGTRADQGVRPTIDARRSVTIVIPYRDQVRYLKRCLKSLAAVAEPGFRVRVVLIDNASRRPVGRDFLDSLDRLEFTVIRNSKNEAVSGPWNAGIRMGFEQHGSDAVCLLNSDVIVGNGLISRCVEALDDGAWCAMPFCYTENNILPLDFYERAGLAAAGDLKAAFHQVQRRKQHARGDNYFKDGRFEPITSFEGTHETDGFCGFCFWVSQECIEKIGYIDENMTLLCSDVDYRNRLIAAGHPPVCVHRSIAHHFGSRTLGPLLDTPRQEAIMKQDRVYFRSKWTAQYDQDFRCHCIGRDPRAV